MILFFFKRDIKNQHARVVGSGTVNKRYKEMSNKPMITRMERYLLRGTPTRRLYVRPFRKLQHPKTGAPFLYIYWKRDGWFLVKQLAEHVLNVTYHALRFRIWCAMSELPGNTRKKWKRLCRCIPLRHPAVRDQIEKAGVNATTMLDSNIYMVDLQTTRYILKSYDTQTKGNMFRLFEAMLELCYGPPDGIYSISTNGNPLSPINPYAYPKDYVPMIDFEKDYFECECGRHYGLSVDNGQVQKQEGDYDNDSVYNYPKRGSGERRRRNTSVTTREKMWLLAAQKYKCNACGTPIGTLYNTSSEDHTPKTKNKIKKVVPFEVDHRIERSRGGCNDPMINLQALCLNCHRYKTMEAMRRPFEAIKLDPG
jgi:hypothetical protein